MLFQLIIIQVITFLAIVFALKKFLYTETAKEAIRLRALKEENTRKQKELQERIEAAETADKERIARVEEDNRRNRTNAEKEALEAKNRIIREAKEEAEQIVKAAFNRKEKIREELILELQKKTPAAASRIFKEVLSSEAKKIVHDELVDKVAAHIKKIEQVKFKINVKRVELTSAYPLEGRQKNILAASISDRLGKKIDFDEKEDKKLIAGVIVQLGTLVIDGSLENRLRQIEAGG